MPADPNRVAAIFAAAIAKPAEERVAYLDQACGDDAELRRRVETLLQAHDDAGSFLNQPAVAPPITTDAPAGQWIDRDAPSALSEGPGTRIGPYKLLQQIGEGGMGVVYMAEQEQPVRRRVALKIIKPGMDTRQVIARFEAERQALAMMDHPNIAHVFDGGTTESGRPFFVMELVYGVPITKFCDDSQLTPRQRLELFVPICQAIQHAHQKGIIHRDIKPSNVLVTMHDDKPLPKVIDFGVAKAIEQRLTEKSLFTAFGAMVGTLEYMSPEQAEMNAFGVDTRGDVYSLGVLLYELLTGTTPLERKRLREAACTEVLRLIKEVEPPRPSVRLSSSGDLPKIAAARKMEPARLSRLLRGEIDWIVMRCLEKDRTRRYESASALARDVERYLHDEAVEACPPSVGYRLGKFARKYRVLLSTVAAFAALLLIASGVSIWLALATRQAESVARRERDEADNARSAEAEAKHMALDQRDRAVQAAAIGELLLAQAAWKEGEFGSARNHLNVIPPEHRGLEWHFLKKEYVGGIFALVGHKGTVNDAAYSPDCKTIATCGDDETVRLWDARTGAPLEVLRAHAGAVQTLAYSPDGSVLASGDDKGSVLLWDTNVKKTKLALAGHTQAIACLAFDPKGRKLVTASADATARIWDTSTGQMLRLLKGAGGFDAIDWASNGEVLASRETGNWTVSIWDAATGKELRSTRGSGTRLGDKGKTLKFSPDSAFLFLADAYNDVIVLDWRTMKRKEEMTREQKPLRGPVSVQHGRHGRVMALSPDGAFVATAGEPECILREIATKGIIRRLKGHEGVESIAFSPDGRHILTAGTDGLVRIWDWQTQTGGEQNITFHRIPHATTFSFAEVTASSVGMFGLQVEENQAILVNLVDGKVIRRISTANGALKKAQMDGQATILVTIDGAGNAQLWDLKTGLARGTLGRLSGNFSADFSGDGKKLFLAAVEEKQTVCGVWDVAAMSRLASWNSLPGLERSAMSPDGKLLALGFGTEKPVVVHDLTTGAVLRSIPLDPAHSLGPMAFDPSGPRLLITSHTTVDNLYMKPYASLWDLDKGTKVFSLHGIWNNSGIGLTGVQFSPDGSRIITDNFSGLLQIWHGRTGQFLLTIPDLEGPSFYMLMREDGRLFGYYADRFQAFVVSFSPRPDSRDIAFSQVVDEAESKRRRELTEVGSSWHEARINYEAPLGHWFAASDHAERLRNVLPSASEGLVKLGHVHLLANKPIAGAWCFVRATLLDPSQSWHPKDRHLLFALVGAKAAEQQKWNLAADCYGKALRCDPARPAWLSLGLSYLAAKDEQSFLRLRRKAFDFASQAKIEHGSVDSILRLAIQMPYTSAQEIEIVRRLVRRLLEEAHRKNEAAQERTLVAYLGEVEYRAGNYQEAKKRLSELFASHPEEQRRTGYLFLAMSLMRLGESNQAQKWLDKVEKEEVRLGTDYELYDGRSAASDWTPRHQWELLYSEAKALCQKGK